MAKCKVAVIVLPPLNPDVPPLGAAYIHAALRRAGVNSILIDFAAPHSTSYSQPASGSNAAAVTHARYFAQWAARLRETGATIVGFSVWVCNARTTTEFSAYLRKHFPKTVQIFGGPECHPANMDVLTTFADYCVFNEGEDAIVKLVDCIGLKQAIGDLPNVYYRSHGRVVCTGQTEGLVDIHALPIPDFTDLDLAGYSTRDGVPVRIPLQLSRGCIGRCSFCTLKRYHATQRARKGESVYNEIIHQKNVHQTNRFYFVDDSFVSAVTRPSIIDLCRLLIENDAGIEWIVSASRVDRIFLENGFTELLYGAGLREITLGVESFADGVLTHMKKGASGALAADIIVKLFNSGIRVNLYIIYGYPVETDEDFATTMHQLGRLGNCLNYVVCNVFGPTEQYDSCVGPCARGAVRRNADYEHSWISDCSNIETRENRFLAIVKRLQSIKENHGTYFGFLAGDAHQLRYFSNWCDEEERSIRLKWNELHGSPKTIGLR